MTRDGVRYAELDRQQATELAPRTSALLRVLARYADPHGRVTVARDRLAAETGLDPLGVELALAIATGRGAVLSCRWVDWADDGEATLVARIDLAPAEGSR